MKGKGKPSFRTVKIHRKIDPKGLTEAVNSLMALKKWRKRSDFVIYSHLGDSAFSAIKKDALQPRPQGFSLKKWL